MAWHQVDDKSLPETDVVQIQDIIWCEKATRSQYPVKYMDTHSSTNSYETW